MKQILRLLFGIMPCLFLSCDYSPSGSHYEDVNPNPTGIVRVTLNEFQDTVLVRGYMHMFFDLYLPGRSFYGHTLEFDGRKLSEGNDTGRGYIFYSEKYTDGYHELKYSAYTSSGTGSLADRNGREALLVTKTWVVLIDNAPPPAPAITAVFPEDGQLKIITEPYKGRFFKRLELRRKFGEMAEYPIGFSDDPTTTNWIDDTYLGGEATYRVVVYLSDINSSIGTGTAYHYHYPLPTILSTTHTEPNAVKITFSSTPFYRNYQSHHISTDFDLYETSNRLDTVVTLRGIKFGRDYESRLVTLPLLRHRDFDADWYTTRDIIPSRGTAWGPFIDATMHRSAATDRFTIWQEGTIYQVDASTLQVLKQRDVGHPAVEYQMNKSAVSVDGRYTYIALMNNIHKLDPATLQSVETFALRDLLPSSDYSNFSIRVSNTNRLMLTGVNYLTKEDTTYLLDMNTRKVLTKVSVSYNTADGALSPDGKAMRVGNRLFKAQGDGTWKLDKHLPHSFDFHPTKPLYYSKSGRTITFYAIETGVVMHRLTTELEYGYYEIDPGSGYLFEKNSYMNQDPLLYVYNIETGQLIRKLDLAINVSAFVYKDRIFSQQRYIKL